MIAGLLVLAILLSSGTPAALAMLRGSNHHDANLAGQTVSAAGNGVTTPARDRDHGLPCCIAGQCTLHAYWVSARPSNAACLSVFAIVYRPSRDASPPGTAARPVSPPPRAAV
ncbi:MAG TPA: hypothetical protein VND19_24970 [Acetobacteraceae bacterium]|nr:hypothetical protein [Acetobacteraceae bacterium]